MGNQPSVRKKCHLARIKQNSPRHNRKLCIYRVLGYFPDKDPDVDSLGFPFIVCKKIFLSLSLADLSCCMLVCKEWRSLIDTCAFWSAYIGRNYGSRSAEPDRHTALHWWKHSQSDGAAPGHVTSADQPYVFKPFPDLWICGVVVPSGMEPPTGSVDHYHSFLKAVEAMRRISELLACHGLGNIVHPCLFRWTHSRQLKPSPADVMDAFGAHALLRHDVEKSGSGLADDLARVGCPQGVDLRGQTSFIAVFSRCFQLGTRDWMVAFHCSHELLEPAPGFIVTPLSQGWVGGLLYAV